MKQAGQLPTMPHRGVTSIQQSTVTTIEVTTAQDLFGCFHLARFRPVENCFSSIFAVARIYPPKMKSVAILSLVSSAAAFTSNHASQSSSLTRLAESKVCSAMGWESIFSADFSLSHVSNCEPLKSNKNWSRLFLKQG